MKKQKKIRTFLYFVATIFYLCTFICCDKVEVENNNIEDSISTRSYYFSHIMGPAAVFEGETAAFALADTPPSCSIYWGGYNASLQSQFANSAVFKFDKPGMAEITADVYNRDTHTSNLVFYTVVVQEIDDITFLNSLKIRGKTLVEVNENMQYMLHHLESKYKLVEVSWLLNGDVISQDLLINMTFDSVGVYNLKCVGRFVKDADIIPFEREITISVEYPKRKLSIDVINSYREPLGRYTSFSVNVYTEDWNRCIYHNDFVLAPDSKEGITIDLPIGTYNIYAFSEMDNIECESKFTLNKMNEYICLDFLGNQWNVSH